MKVVAIIQARMGSTRLPGKVMKRLDGIPVLAHVMRRVQAVRTIDETVVATTELPADDIIESSAHAHGAHSFRGSEHDVLDRYYWAALQRNADAVVRVTADCPLLDPQLLDTMVGRFRGHQNGATNADYLSNTQRRTYPRGLDVEIFRFPALQRAWHDAHSPAEREHVTPYIYRHPELFNLVDHVGAKDLSHYRLTLDTQEDWTVLEALCTSLRCGSKLPGIEDIVGYLNANPELAALNAAVEQKGVGP